MLCDKQRNSFNCVSFQVSVMFCFSVKCTGETLENERVLPSSFSGSQKWAMCTWRHPVKPTQPQGPTVVPMRLRSFSLEVTSLLPPLPRNQSPILWASRSITSSRTPTAHFATSCRSATCSLLYSEEWMYLFSIPTVTNYHKLSGLKHKFTILNFCKLKSNMSH